MPHSLEATKRRPARRMVRSSLKTIGEVWGAAAAIKSEIEAHLAKLKGEFEQFDTKLQEPVGHEVRIRAGAARKMILTRWLMEAEVSNDGWHFPSAKPLVEN